MGHAVARDYTINEVIREFINENDKSPMKIADKAGIRRDTFSRILKCKRPIYADELIPILNAAGIPLDTVTDAVQAARRSA